MKLAAAALATVSRRYLPLEPSMPTRHPVADVSALAPGRGQVLDVGGKPIAVFNVDGKYFAMDNTCPHRGGPLADGPLMGTTVTCPWHGWQFDCTTGKSTRNAAVCVTSYPTNVEGSTIYVEV